MIQAGRPWRLVLVLAVGAVGLVWGGWKCWEVRRFRKAMAEIEADVDASRYGLAARNLAALLAWRPDSDQAAFLLGQCERARGRADAAALAWAKVPAGSSFALQATQGRMELEIERGQFARAEQLVKDAMADPRGDKPGLRLLLGPLFCMQGRSEEARRLIEPSWDHLATTGQATSQAAVSLLRLHIDLQRRVIPIEATRAFLDEAAGSAPEDDRVWLGKANLAIRAGSYDEAARWLDACLRRRPDDAPVWRARLSWAMATGRAAEVREALEHLPSAEIKPAQVQKLAAWFAARRGDSQAELQALERVIAIDPADFASLDGLATLVEKAGHPDRAALLRGQKAATRRMEARYWKLYERYQPKRDAVEMAGLAEQLGRPFEAKAFLALAVAVDPHRADLRRDLSRLSQQATSLGEPPPTVAGLLAELDSQADSSPSAAAHARARTRESTRAQ
jgi:thioredoxin-like negative regulator of GroEL